MPIEQAVETEQEKELRCKRAFAAAWRVVPNPDDADLIIAYGMGLAERLPKTSMATLAYGEPCS